MPDTVLIPDSAGAVATILAFDYGDARIGVAVGNSLLKIPHPLATISAEGMYAKLDLIAALILKWQPTHLVVGIPSTATHESQEAAAGNSLAISERVAAQKVQLINTINNFAKRLGKKFSLAVVMINEDFSSAEAASQLKQQGVYGKAQTGKLDQLAACAILQGYFDSRR